MELTIRAKTEEPLLGRKKVVADVLYDKATPSNADVKVALAKEFDVDADVVSVHRIAGKFGQTQADVLAYVYTTAAKRLELEPEKKKKSEEDDE